MKLGIRPPQDDEWRICRMLLPETSFRQRPESVTHLRLHVVPSFRRCGAGSQMIEHVARIGAPFLEGTVEVTKEPGAEEFCEHNHFERVEALTTVEAEIAEMRECMRRLRSRIVPPPEARVIRLSEAPLDQVALLHAQHVAQEGELGQWRGLVAQTSAMGISPVVTIAGRVAGILLGELDGATAVVRSRVVAPGYHGSWVNAM